VVETTRIIYIPIEPYEERYSSQWYRWFPSEFRKAGYNVLTIDGESLTGGVIERGEVLDITSAYYYEFTQMLKLIKMFHRGEITKDDIIFCADIEYPGHTVTAKYLSTLLKIPCKIYGFLHAGTYTKEDFIVPCEPWQKYFELGWLEAFDGVFVGSEYHKNQIIRRRISALAPWALELTDKIHVTGDPWNTSEALEIVGINPTAGAK